MQRPTNFRYLNRDGRWLGFHLSGVEVTADGALELMARPRLAADPPAGLDALPAPDGPSGIAVTADGTVWFTDPDGSAIYAVGGCDGASRRLRSGVDGGETDPLLRPRGLAVLTTKHQLVVADSGNHRLLLFDDRSLALRETWGARTPAGAPRASAEPGGFDTPWSVASDRNGRLYVLDYGNRRIQKFDRAGTADADFATRFAASGLVRRPGGLAVGGVDVVRVYELDLDSNTIWLFDETGSPVVDEQRRPRAIRWDGLQRPLALAADARTLYVGDNGLRAIVVFRATAEAPDRFDVAGLAAGYAAPVGALAIDRQHRILAHPGGATLPLVLAPDGAYASAGVFWSDAIDADGQIVPWDRVAATMASASAGHVTFYWATGAGPQPPPVRVDAANPFGDARWQPVQGGATTFRVTSKPARYLFLGARFTGDHDETPRLRQLRADFASDRALARLPAIYREPAPGNEYLARWVALHQSIVDEVDDAIARMPATFDTHAAPPEDLAWLATLLAVDVDPDAPSARARDAIARAYERYRWRGTVRGLLLALEDELGVRARVIEPVFAGAFWTLPARNACEDGTVLDGWSDASASIVGVSTRLSPMEPEGAVLDVTATLDRSHVATVERGAPLFETVAHQFVVQVFAADALTADRQARIARVVERNAPAHTSYRIEAITPSMRVGFQARVGIDTIVAGDAPPARLGATEVRLGGSPPARIGSSRVGSGVTI